MNYYNIHHLSAYSITLITFLLSSLSLQATDNLEEKLGKFFVKIEKDIAESLEKQTFVLGQTFTEKVQPEEDKKKHLIEETKGGIEQKTKNLALIKGKIKEQTGLISREIDKISLFLDDETGNEYSDKMQSLNRNTDKIGVHLKSIDTFSDELDSVSREMVDFAKKQTDKISLHHDSLVHKGKEFDEGARTVIEKNRELSLGVMKGKTSEILMVVRSLGVMLSDKQEQVESYKEQIKDTGENFKHHENVLVGQHDKHLSDIKDGRKELIEEKDKLFSQKQEIVKKLRDENKQLENEVEKYRQETNKLKLQIFKISAESSVTEGVLKATLIMMGVNGNELNDCNTSMLAQKFLSKYLEMKK